MVEKHLQVRINQANILFIVILTFPSSISCADLVCCTPDQWEGNMYLDNGNAFIDNYLEASAAHVGTVVTYINGSLRTAYDFTNGQTYIKANVLQISPLIPHPVMEQTTQIRNYKNGIEYQFYGKRCSKSTLAPLKRHCVPGEAVHLGAGTLGEERVPVSTFAYTLTDFPYQFQSTVTRKGCVPVHATYLVASSKVGSGAVYSLEISDVTTGIKDPSIFNVPPQCKNGHTTLKTPVLVKSLKLSNVGPGTEQQEFTMAGKFILTLSLYIYDKSRIQ